MTLDSHQHFWQYNPVKDAWITDDMKILQRDFMPNDLQGVLRENGMAGCVAVQADPAEAETHFLIELARGHSFIKGVVGWVDLCSESVEARLTYFSRFPIVKGFRHLVQAEPDPGFLQRPDFCRGIGLLEQFNFTYDLLIRPHQLASANLLCRQFPNQRFIVDHLAKPAINQQQPEPWRRDIFNLAKNEHVYCKLSGLVTEANWQHWKPEDFIAYLDTVFEAFGENRILYGSDWPVCLVAATYQEQLQLVTNYLQTFPESVRAKVMGVNAVNFYNL